MWTGETGSIHRMHLFWSWTGEFRTERQGLPGPCPGQERHSQVPTAEAVLVPAARELWGEPWHLLGPVWVWLLALQPGASMMTQHP